MNGAEQPAVQRLQFYVTEQAALKHLHLAVISLDPTGCGRQRWSNRWRAALNAFGITLDGRLSAGWDASTTGNPVTPLR